MSYNWLMLSSYGDTCFVHCCWCRRRHIVLIVELVIVKNFYILCLQCSVKGLLLLILACFRILRSYVGFILALSAQLLVLLLLLANLTGLVVLVLLLTSFASHCYFLRHRVFWFWIDSIAKYCFIFWVKLDQEYSETSQNKTCLVFLKDF